MLRCLAEEAFRCTHRVVSEVSINGPQLFLSVVCKGKVFWFPYVDAKEVLKFEALCHLSVSDLRAVYRDVQTIFYNITHCKKGGHVVGEK